MRRYMHRYMQHRCTLHELLAQGCCTGCVQQCDDVSSMVPFRPRFAARLALVVLGGLGHEGSLHVAAAGGGAAACAVGAAGMGGRGNEESRGAGAWE